MLRNCEPSRPAKSAPLRPNPHTSDESTMRRLYIAISRILSRLREDGVTRTIAWLRYRREEARWERRFGVPTGSAIGAASLSRDFEEYQPSDYQLIARALDWSRPTADDVLLDYGCGKGRVLFVGAGYPFRRIVGFELCPEMAALGRANVQAARLPSPAPPSRFRSPMPRSKLRRMMRRSSSSSTVLRRSSVASAAARPGVLRAQPARHPSDLHPTARPSKRPGHL